MADVLFLDANSLKYAYEAAGNSTALLDRYAAYARAAGYELAITDVVRDEIRNDIKGKKDFTDWLFDKAKGNNIKIIETDEFLKLQDYFSKKDANLPTGNYVEKNAGDRSIAESMAKEQKSGGRPRVFSDDGFFNNGQELKKFGLGKGLGLTTAEMLNNAAVSGAMTPEEFAKFQDGYRSNAAPWKPNVNGQGSYSGKLDTFLTEGQVKDVVSGKATFSSTNMSTLFKGLKIVGIAALAYDIGTSTADAADAAGKGDNAGAGNIMARLMGRIYGGLKGAAAGAALGGAAGAPGGPASLAGSVVGALGGGLAGATLGDVAVDALWKAANEAISLLQSGAPEAGIDTPLLQPSGKYYRGLIASGMPKEVADKLMQELNAEYKERRLEQPDLSPEAIIESVIKDVRANQAIEPQEEAGASITTIKGEQYTTTAISSNTGKTETVGDTKTGKPVSTTSYDGEGKKTGDIRINADGSSIEQAYDPETGRVTASTTLQADNSSSKEVFNSDNSRIEKAFNSQGELVREQRYDASGNMTFDSEVERQKQDALLKQAEADARQAEVTQQAAEADRNNAIAAQNAANGRVGETQANLDVLLSHLNMLGSLRGSGVPLDEVMAEQAQLQSTDIPQAQDARNRAQQDLDAATQASKEAEQRLQAATQELQRSQERQRQLVMQQQQEAEQRHQQALAEQKQREAEREKLVREMENTAFDYMKRQGTFSNMTPDPTIGSDQKEADAAKEEAAAKAEAERKAAEAAAKAETDRLAAEQRAVEEARAKAEEEAAAKAEAERIAAEQAAAEQAAAQAEAERLAAEAERKEKERIEAEEVAKRLAAQFEADRIAAQQEADRQRDQALREAQERQRQMNEQWKREDEERKRQAAADQARRDAEAERLRQQMESTRIPGSGGGPHPAPGIPIPIPRPGIIVPRPGITVPGGGGVGVPVVLDLDGNGVLDIRPLVSVATTAMLSEGGTVDSNGRPVTEPPVFDWNGDGVADQTAWVGPGDGLLVIDLAGDGEAGPDGRIDQPHEIAFALWKTEDERQAELKVQGIDDTGRPISDLEGLRYAFDSNGDNVLDANDTRWNEFRVWQDHNQNGVAEDGELRTLDEVGIKFINLLPSLGGSKVFADGSAITGTSTAQKADGTSMLVGDVTLTFRPSVAA